MKGEVSFSNVSGVGGCNTASSHDSMQVGWAGSRMWLWPTHTRCRHVYPTAGPRRNVMLRWRGYLDARGAFSVGVVMGTYSNPIVEVGLCSHTTLLGKLWQAQTRSPLIEVIVGNTPNYALIQVLSYFALYGFYVRRPSKLPFDWVYVKELKLSYHNPKPILVPYIHILAT